MDGQSQPSRPSPFQEERLIDPPRPMALGEFEDARGRSPARVPREDGAPESVRGIAPAKRAFDLSLAVLAAPLWLTTLVLAATAIAVTSGLPVLYISSRRVGRRRTARVLKLRVMVKNAERLVNRDTVPIDGARFLNIPSTSPVYTRVGRWIERCSLTELPQLFNVLRGEMSIIGNRPLPENVVAALSASFPEAEERFGTPAGLAGPVQLVGRDQLGDAERLELEIAYCEACRRAYSPLLDLYVLVNTILICLRLRRRLTVPEVREVLRRFSRRALPEGGGS
ncbi:MAG: sugar transferase [Planctomycetes bacterium]|nr:sugar transferase [Planctomycetota bacterium]